MTGWNNSPLQLPIPLRRIRNPDAAGARPSGRGGRSGEYRGDELGLAATAFAHPETDPDGAGRCRQ